MPIGRSGVRLVADTNTVVSGLLWPGGPPARIIDFAEAGRIELATSAALLAELQSVLGRAKFLKQLTRRGLDAGAIFDGYAALALRVAPAATPRVVARDPDDDHVIACAIAARAEIIVSGDRDLLDLGRYGEVRILSAASAAAEIEARRG